MNFKYELKKIEDNYSYVAGCDEVGRGCLAGPVVAAAVVFDPTLVTHALSEVRDSKLLSAKKREELSTLIKSLSLAWSIAEVSPAKIDKINIHNASLLAIRKAVEGLGKIHIQKTFLYVDGKFTIPNFDIEQQAVIGGDDKVLSIAASSIIAKVYRDELMKKFDKQYPVYNFAKHKGYATEIHRKQILSYGLSPIHRITFCKNWSNSRP